MRLTENQLRRIIRTLLIESEDNRVYDDTVLPGEEADDELLAEPDLTDQEDRDDYINDREKLRSKKKRDRLNSREETEEGMADESSIVGGGGMSGHIGTSWGPRREERPLHSRNAMGGGKRKKRSLDEYDE